MLWLIGHQLMVGGRRWEKRRGSGFAGIRLHACCRDYADRCPWCGCGGATGRGRVV